MDLGKSLRALHNGGDYEIFELPYCSRCPKVIVDSVNQIVDGATAKGYLKGRIDKSFVAYEPEKEEINRNYPKLIILNMRSGAAAKEFLSIRISQILENELNSYNDSNETDPLVMIICDNKYKNKISEVTDAFSEHLIPVESKQGNIALLLEAYDLLVENSDSNFAWRLLMKFDRDSLKYKYPGILRKISERNKLIELLPSGFVEKHKEIFKHLKVLNTDTSDDEKTNAMQSLKVLLIEEDFNCIFEMFNNKENEKEDMDSKKYPVHFTTYQSSKGLAADYVIMVGVNDGDLPKDPANIEDYEICNLIVGLTRTKKMCYVLSVKNVRSTTHMRSSILDWIPATYLDESPYLSVRDVKKLMNSGDYDTI